MPNVTEALKTPGKCPVPEGTWIQITFTLDPAHYRALWLRAEEEHRTVADLVRETMTGSLEKIKDVSRKIKSLEKQNEGNLS